jgi:N-acetylmuramoyl-L-alanine amidase
MKRITVKKDDTIASIARAHGLFVATVWDHPDNTELREKRGDPNILMEGDEVAVPERRKRREKVPSGQKTSFKRLGIPEKLRIRFVDREEEARANLPFTVDFGRQTVEGTTDADGMLEATIPVGATRARIEIEGERYDVEVGALDPIDTDSGLQARLNNLGFDCGDVDGEVGDRTAIALAEFQRAHTLEVTGEADSATVDKLREILGES